MRRRFRLSSWCSAAAVAVVGMVLGPGCSTEESADCPGVVVDGECQEKCDPAQCAEGHACVGNQCRPACRGERDCPAGYNCTNVFIDGTDGQTGFYCFRGDYAVDGGTGQGNPCSDDSACDVKRGFSCVGGTCRLRCQSHLDCGSFGHCDRVDGELTCVRDEEPRAAGQYGTFCPRLEGCAEGFACVGQSSDPDNYCAKTGCTRDADCAVGHTCDLRGTVAPPVRCKLRQYCDACETDVDCLGVPGQLCARDASGRGFCTVACDPSLPRTCPGGNSSVCSRSDPSRDFPICSHRSGSCVGDGAACAACRVDSDCGGPGEGYCVELPGTRERACFDMTVECDSHEDCPATPAGVPMECTFGPGVPRDYLFYRRCTPPNVAQNPIASREFGCYPPP